jgi:hypothetical protein
MAAGLPAGFPNFLSKQEMLLLRNVQRQFESWRSEK